MPLLENLRLRLLEGALDGASRLAVRLGRAPATAPHLALGTRGETAAFFYLRRQGYVVVARGYRSSLRRGDIDVVAWEGGVLCFVEVKTRTSRAVAPAEAAVDEHKRETLRRLARVYLRRLEDEPPVRFDVLSIYFEGGRPAEFELFRGAFDWFER